MKLTTENFLGGLSLKDERNLEDNQFSVLKNMYVDAEKRLSTRRGITTFGTSIGDDPITGSFFVENEDGRFLLATAGTGLYRYNESTDGFDLVENYFTPYNNHAVLSACNTDSSSFTGTGDAKDVAFTSTDIKRGDASLEFSIGNALTPPAGTTATLTSNLATAVDLSDYEDTGKIRFWCELIDASKITSIEFRWGSDSSNYWTKTLTADIYGNPLSNNYKYFEIDWATATEVGSPSSSAVDYLQFIITHTAVVKIEDLHIDYIACYPTTSDAGEDLTRPEFAHYNGGIGIVNGIDPYMVYSTNSGDLAIEGEVMGRYIKEIGTRIFIAGDDDNPSTLYYSDATPANMDASIYTNSLLVGSGNGGDINLLGELDNVILVGKERASYEINVTAGTASKVDATNGMFGQRALHNVGNSLFYASQRGIDALAARSGLETTSGVESKPKTDDLQNLFNDIEPRRRNLTNGIYIKGLKQYYLCFDTDDDGVPDTTLVWNSTDGVESWTEYEYPDTYTWVEYKTSTGDFKYLLGSANSGQFYEIEVGFTDNEVAISHEMTSKKWDFGDPEMWKDYETMDFFGYMSENAEFNIEIKVDGTTITSVDVDSTFADTNAVSRPIGVYPIGVYPIGGGADAGVLETFPYKVRIPVLAGGQTVEFSISSEKNGTQWTLDRMSITYEKGGLDMFEFNSIA